MVKLFFLTNNNNSKNVLKFDIIKNYIIINTKIKFLAYLSLLESSALNERIRDPEVKPIMDDIISMYNTEKPTIYTNQYANFF